MFRNLDPSDANFIEDALKVSYQKNKTRDTSSYIKIAKAEAKIGNFSHASELLETISDDDLRADVLISIAVSQMSSGSFSEALRTYKLAESQFQHEYTIKKGLMGFISAAQCSEEFSKLIYLIYEAPIQQHGTGSLLKDVVSNVIERLDVFDIAINLSDKIPRTEKGMFYNTLSKSFAKKRDFLNAMEMVHYIGPSPYDPAYVDSMDDALRHIAYYKSEVRDFSSCLKILDAIRDPQMKCSLHLKFALTHHEDNDLGQMKLALNRSISIAEKVDKEFYCRCYCRIAETMAKVGKFEEALQFLPTIDDYAEYGDDREIAVSKGIIAAHFAINGNFEKVTEFAKDTYAWEHTLVMAFTEELLKVDKAEIALRILDMPIKENNQIDLGCEVLVEHYLNKETKPDIWKTILKKIYDDEAYLRSALRIYCHLKRAI